MNAFHDSRQLTYRSPFGAVPVETAVKLTLDVQDATAPRCFLRYWVDGLGESLMPMAPEKVSKGFRFTATLVPTTPAVYWYTFVIWDGDRELRYGAAPGETGGAGQLTHDKSPRSYQLTAYVPREVPAWYRNGVVYQIFPDRFARDENWRERTEAVLSQPRKGPTRRLVEDWYAKPTYLRSPDRRIQAWDFYGGSLKGIEEKLDYLKDLGVTVLYLNPIFQSYSNHRYDTGDFMKIDPILGTEEDFRSLAASAKERGIRIILDGVFNHTGCDSVYFNRDGNYGEGGAYRDVNSPYRSWYKFDNSPSGYSSWWGVDDLPDIIEDDPSYRAFINGEDGVVRHWLREGASGWRLDVADELPDSFIAELKRAVVDEKGDEGLVIGEVWEDASNKIAYGQLRHYLLGEELDGTMNYPGRDILGNFVRGITVASEVKRRLTQLYENYPRPAFYAAMNLLGSHDRARSLTLLGGAPDAHTLSEKDQAAYRLSPAQRQLAKQRMWLSILLQMTIPGVPCIYYGDEAGVEGYADPFNRASFPWGKEDKDLFDMFRNGIGLRRMSAVFTDGDFEPVSFGDEVFGYWRRLENERALVLINRSKEHSFPITVNAELDDVSELINGLAVPIVDGKVTLTLPQLGSAVLLFHKEQRLAAKLEPGTGILAHITSLPNKDGPGSIRASTKRFLDWMKKHQHRYWQILPLNPPDEFGSPYAGSSAFAGNLRLVGWPEEELRRMFTTFKPDEGYAGFLRREARWLEPFAVYEALSARFGGAWQTWPEQYRTFSEALLEDKQLQEEAAYYKFTQYLFDVQWHNVRRDAKEAGVSIIGDIPMYVSAGSCDCWANPELFELDADGNPALVAGVPPDYFSEEGQLWGNPIFRWEQMAKDGYSWWMERFRRAFALYDFVRLDHFRGFESYWAIPAGQKAPKGKWVFGPGMALFEAAHAKFGDLRLLAEDLGFVTPGVRALLTRTGFNGTEVMEFYEGDPLVEYKPPKGKVCYTGTHDNQTLLGWLRDRYPANDEERTRQTLLKNFQNCGAEVRILPLQDVLGLGDEARMNTPGTVGNNWVWQAEELRKN